MRAIIVSFCLMMILPGTANLAFAQYSQGDPALPTGPKTEADCQAYANEWSQRINFLEEATTQCSNAQFAKCKGSNLNIECYRRNGNPIADCPWCER